MAKKHSGKRRRSVPKTVLRLPDLDQDKSAVLNNLSSIGDQLAQNQVLAGGTEPTGPHESRMQNRASPYIRNFSLCCDN